MRRAIFFAPFAALLASAPALAQVAAPASAVGGGPPSAAAQSSGAAAGSGPVSLGLVPPDISTDTSAGGPTIPMTNTAPGAIPGSALYAQYTPITPLPGVQSTTVGPYGPTTYGSSLVPSANRGTIGNGVGAGFVPSAIPGYTSTFTTTSPSPVPFGNGIGNTYGQSTLQPSTTGINPTGMPGTYAQPGTSTAIGGGPPSGMQPSTATPTVPGSQPGTIPSQPGVYSPTPGVQPGNALPLVSPSIP
jgi:hypothetical protein